jgi:hypothetical protein
LLWLATSGRSQYYQPPPRYQQQPYYQPQPQIIYQDRVEYRDRIVPVVQPVPFTVAVPVISYLYNGSSFSPVFNAQTTVANPGLQVAQTTQQQVQSVQQTQQVAGGQLQLDDAFIDKLIDRIEQRLQQRNKQPIGPPPVRKDEALHQQVVTILSNNCASCHTAPKAKGGITMFLGTGVFNPAVDKKKIFDAADEGRMPPAAKTDPSAALNDADIALLRRWRDSE